MVVMEKYETKTIQFFQPNRYRPNAGSKLGAETAHNWDLFYTFNKFWTSIEMETSTTNPYSVHYILNSFFNSQYLVGHICLLSIDVSVNTMFRTALITWRRSFEVFKELAYVLALSKVLYALTYTIFCS